MPNHARKAETLEAALREHSAEGIEILSAEPSRFTRATIYLLFGLLVSAGIWSFFGQANVIVKAEGKLVPESEVRRVYSAVDGELIDVYMDEGMPVSRNDVLARINSVDAVQMAIKAVDAKAKLLDAEERYRLFPAEVEFMQQRLALLKNQMGAEEKMHEKQLTEGIAKLAEEYRIKLENARTKLDKARIDADRAKAVWDQHERLFNSPGGGGIAKDTLEEKKQAYQARLSEYKLAENALGEFEVELNREYLRKQEDIQKKLEDLLRTRSQYQEQVVKLEQARQRAETELRLARLTAEGAARVTFDDIDENSFLRIRAPVSGVLTEVAFTQPGDKVESRRPLASIAPKDARKILELAISEADRGFLKEGLPVKIKFNAFPYQRYGLLNGTLEYIAPTTTVSPDTKKVLYKARVGLEKDYISVEDTRFQLRYGMTATAEIVVRKRRIIDTALDPLRKVAG
jgi:hemolysin D